MYLQFAKPAEWLDRAAGFSKLSSIKDLLNFENLVNRS